MYTSDQPTVSIIIPAYNSGHYLDEAVASVIAQTYTDWECIVVDDGSSEDLSRIKSLDQRVRLIRQPNGGTQAARNNAIVRSKAKFLAFFDHDDIWLPTKLEQQMAAMAEDADCAFVHTGFDVIGAHGQKLNSGWAKEHAGYVDMMRDPGGWCFSSVLVRREIFLAAGLLDIQLMHTGDWDLMLKVARGGSQVFIPEVLCRYRKHSTNTSRNYAMMCREALMVMDKHALAAEYCGDQAVLDAIAFGRKLQKQNFGCQAYSAARTSLSQKEINRFARNLGLAFRWNPTYTLRALGRYFLLKLRLNRKHAA